MRQVILYGEVDGPSRGLGEALRAAGVRATRVEEARTAGNGKEDSRPLAVLFDVTAGEALAGLHAAVERAAAEWPEMPVVACQRDPEDEPPGAAQRLDASTLKRLGFHAVATEPAQLSAVLREVEEQVLNRGRQGQPFPEVAPASILQIGRAHV